MAESRRRWRRGILIVGVTIVLLTGAALTALRGWGVDARSEPSTIEKQVALFLRGWMTPVRYKTMANPVPGSPEVLASGREHFADHCASCHANNGSGDTEMGRALYPRAPDMRQARTQTLSDGEIFYIIEHGVRLTGMPAWGTGTPEGEEASWHLVHFIRHLPSITAEEIAEMEQLNPKSPTEFEEQRSIEEFLNGGAPSPTPHKHPQ